MRDLTPFCFEVGHHHRISLVDGVIGEGTGKKQDTADVHEGGGDKTVFDQVGVHCLSRGFEDYFDFIQLVRRTTRSTFLH